MNTFNLALDVDKRQSGMQSVTIAQGDRNGTTIQATIYDHGTLVTTSGLTARFKMRLPDGRYFYSKAATWTASTGTASVTIDETQAASVVGTTHEAYFELLSGSTVIHSTARFAVRVLRSATPGATEATSYDDRIEEILAAMDVAVEAVEDAQEAATSATSAATSATNAAGTASTAATNATNAANAANAAATSAGNAATAANAAASDASDAAERVDEAIEAVGDISELAVPLMSPTTRGGAKLGRGLAIEDGALSVALESESDGSDAGPIVELTAKGWAMQDGTPSPDYPQEIQVARGRNLLNPSLLNSTYYSTSADGSVTIGGSDGATWSSIQEIPLSAGSYVLSRRVGYGRMALRTSDDGYASDTVVAQGVNTIAFTLASDGGIKLKCGYSYSGVTVTYPFTEYIQLELGSTPTPYVPYGYVGLDVYDGSTHVSTIPVPLPQRGWVASLPDGTADTLTLDGAGKVVWEKATAEKVYDGSSDEVWVVGGSYASTGGGFWRTDNPEMRAEAMRNTNSMCDRLCEVINTAIAANTTGLIGYGNTPTQVRIRPFEISEQMTVEQIRTWLASNPLTFLLPLATPVTEDMGYVDGWTNDFPEGCVLSIPELDALNVRYVVDDAAVTLARQWYERAWSEYEDRIAALEEAVAEIVAG